MANFKREVGGYRGRRTITDILRLIAILLAIAVLLMGAGLFFGQRYIIYTDEGIELDIPFFREEEKPSADPGNMSIMEIPGDTSGQGQEPPVEEPEPEKIEFMRALQLPLSNVVDGVAQARLEQEGANALILEMKAQSGKLSWVSEEKLANMAKANAGDESINEKIRQWNEGDVYTIARVSCFRDDSLPYYCNRVALRTEYGNWRDEAEMRYLDPTDLEAQAYITGLCVELAELGFDEILLEYCTYPVRGRLDQILPTDGDPLKRFEGPERFLSQVCEALEPYDTQVSVRTETGVFTGETVGSGLDAEALRSYSHHLWLDGADFALEPGRLQEYAGHQSAGEWIVAVVDQLWQEGNCHRAFLEER